MGEIQLKRIFIDTNVILDVALEREDFVVDSTEMIRFVRENKFEGFTSSLIYATVYYIHMKDNKHDKSSRHDKAITFLKNLRLALGVLSINQDITDKALSSNFRDFEDAIQYFCALENNIDYIITRDEKDYRKSKIPVYTPNEFVESLEVLL